MNAVTWSMAVSPPTHDGVPLLHPEPVGLFLLRGIYMRMPSPLIAGYKKPRPVLFLDELPRLATGEIDKVLLRSLCRA